MTMHTSQRVLISILATSVVATGCASSGPSGQQATKDVAALQAKTKAAPTAKTKAAPATKTKDAPATKTRDDPAAKAKDDPAAKAEDDPTAKAEDDPAAKAEDDPAAKAKDATSLCTDVPPQLAYYVMLSGEPKGPFDMKELKAAIVTGGIRAETLTWRRGMTHWAPAVELDELRGLLAESSSVADTPPPPPNSRRSRRSRSKRSR